MRVKHKLKQLSTPKGSLPPKQGLIGLKSHYSACGVSSDSISGVGANTPGRRADGGSSRQPFLLQPKSMVRLCPELSVIGLKEKKAIELGLWHRLRAIEVKGRGWIRLELAIEALVSYFGYSRRTAYRQLLKGEGQFWAITNGNTPPTIQIYALEKVFESFTPYAFRTDRHWRELPIKKFQRGQEKAQLYASMFKPKGITADPISRESIERFTGQGKRQQLRLDKLAGIKKTPHYAFQEVPNTLPGRKNKKVPMRMLIITKRKQYSVNLRMANSYHSPLFPSGRGMLRQLEKVSLILDGVSTTRLYFNRARKLARALSARVNPITEGYLLLRNKDRLIPGRMEWLSIANCA